MRILFKIAADIIDCQIANIINKDISNNKFSENAKTATVRSIFKKGHRTEMQNYRPVSLLKIYERFLHENLTTQLTNYVIITYFFVIFWLQTNVTKK